jgi:D-glycero-alpha-D-manno-heptose-7-phosphate kinase
MVDTAAPHTICASAPTRICDNGGWTDTWFAEYGRVFSIAVEPRVDVELRAWPDDGSRPRIVIDAKVFGDRYEPTGIDTGVWGKHSLIEATIAEIGIPLDLAVEVSIDSDAPFGASTGTSAATCVALIGALDALTPGRLSPHDVARTAWRVETERLGQQSGIQDQLAAAFGGISLITMHRYPDATVRQLGVASSILDELQRRLVVVYLGTPHSSSAVHESVIRELELLGPSATAIETLRTTAEPSASALVAGDFAGLGRAMIANTTAQRALHRDLVCSDAQRVIDIGERFGTVGYKVNGAGGSGGSLTLLTDGDESARSGLIDAIADADDAFAVIPITLAARGLTVSAHRPKRATSIP